MDVHIKYSREYTLQHVIRHLAAYDSRGLTFEAWLKSIEPTTRNKRARDNNGPFGPDHMDGTGFVSAEGLLCKWCSGMFRTLLGGI